MSWQKITNFFAPHPDRANYKAEFLLYLENQNRILTRFMAAAAIFAWLAYAFYTDPRLHPEFPELLYFRLGLSVVGIIAFIASFIPSLMKNGFTWIYLLASYTLLSASFFTGRIADDPNYVSGLQLIILLLMVGPFPRRILFSLYFLSIIFFLTSVLIYMPSLNTPAAQYSMNNLIVSYLLAILLTYLLDRFRFDVFYKTILIEKKSQELQKKMEEVHRLKIQQDGDYFLTSLLTEPLNINNISGKNIQVDFFIREKKQFQFRKWQREIGGDMCMAQTIRLRNKNYTLFLNADAMGKSIQGAGGVLVLGAVLKSIIERTLLSTIEQNLFPEKWLRNAFVELQRVFESFNGSMLISLVMGLIDEQTGLVYFVNAEHPWLILHRNGKSSFIENELTFHKIGTQGLDKQFWIQTFALEPGDIIIGGSDGRDDLIMGTDNATGMRIMNDDYNLILKLVDQAKADLHDLVARIEASGEITDDLSLVRILFQPHETKHAIPKEIQDKITEAQKTAEEGNIGLAAKQLEALISNNTVYPELLREIIQWNLKIKKFDKVFHYAIQYIDQNPEDSKYLYYASLSAKMIGDFNSSADYGERLRLRDPGHYHNLLNLADTYRNLGKNDRSQKMLQEAEAIEPNNPVLKKLKSLLPEISTS